MLSGFPLLRVDGDVVEASNLNRQRFYKEDLRKRKAVALAKNLQRESIAATTIRGLGCQIEDLIAEDFDLACDVVVCGVDNNPTRTLVSRFFRRQGIPVIFAAVSADADHGYVFVQETVGPCIACLLPDLIDDDRYPCPGTPAVADVLQLVGALAVYAVDTLLMPRPRTWNYRRVSLCDGAADGCAILPARTDCRLAPELSHSKLAQV